jgi:simple sugar transport system permease protein
MKNRDLRPWILKYFTFDRGLTILLPIIGVVLGLAAAAFIIQLQGVSPLLAYKEMFLGAFGSAMDFSFTLLQFIPLAFAGLAVMFAFRGGSFNIGAEGQIYLGGLASAWFALTFPNLPAALLLPLSLLAGAVAGGLFAWIAGVLKAKRGINEVLVTTLMNYLGTYFVGFAVSTFLKEPNQHAPRSAALPTNSWLPLFKGSYVHTGIILVFVLAILLYFILWHTTWGYEIRSVGLNATAARYSGIPAERVIMTNMFVSGALAGLAGSTVILGVQHRLLENFLVNYGFEAIPIAVLGGLHPAGVLAMALLFGALKNGAQSMQIAVNVPVAIVYMVQAIAIISIIALTSVKEMLSKRTLKGCEEACLKRFFPVSFQRNSYPPASG